ncbi:MAG TPA: outer membrane protein assembly factor BamD [Myxococcota bacterium]|jgi:outer membrane protein assembly factor BamD|nr:outer membrane protein assembly factor BamD [Myxococcota bacterium]
MSRSSIRTLLASLLAGAAVAACAASTPVDEEMPSAEILYRRGLAHLEHSGKYLGVLPNSDSTKAIESFQQIIDNYPYSDYAVLSELKIADAYFADEKYDEALSYYRDFSELHPGHEQVPYALLQAAKCHYNQAKDPQRDQTATRQALGFLDTLLAKYPGTPQATEGETMWKELRTRLGQHEMDIAGFYMAREEYQSAADRYRNILNRYPGLGLDADALYKLGVCYQRMHREDEAKQIFEVILENYKGSDVAAAAADLVPDAN